MRRLRTRAPRSRQALLVLTKHEVLYLCDHHRTRVTLTHEGVLDVKPCCTSTAGLDHRQRCRKTYLYLETNSGGETHLRSTSSRSAYLAPIVRKVLSSPKWRCGSLPTTSLHLIGAYNLMLTNGYYKFDKGYDQYKQCVWKMVFTEFRILGCCAK